MELISGILGDIAILCGERLVTATPQQSKDGFRLIGSSSTAMIDPKTADCDRDYRGLSVLLYGLS